MSPTFFPSSSLSLPPFHFQLFTLWIWPQACRKSPHFLFSDAAVGSAVLLRLLPLFPILSSPSHYQLPFDSAPGAWWWNTGWLYIGDHNQGSRLCTLQSALTGTQIESRFWIRLTQPFGLVAASPDWLPWTQKRIQPRHNVSRPLPAITTVAGTCSHSGPSCLPLPFPASR